MTKNEEFIARVREVETPNIITDDSGYKVFWPPNETGGYRTAEALRVIADYLDELNKPWDDEVKQYFANQR